MCGRAYETYTEDELAVRYGWEKLKRHPLGLKPNYNLAPTQLSPVVIVRDGEISIDVMRFGLVPPWSKTPDGTQLSLINARGEEIDSKPSYKAAFERRRCVVPLSGFFEWQKTGEGAKSPKRPYAIRLKGEAIMSVAGVWERWEAVDGSKIVNSFSIVTTAANEIMTPIHSRMPVILRPEDEKFWLDPANRDTGALKKLLRPCPSDLLEAYEISGAVGNPRNNSAEILLPAPPAAQGDLFTQS